MLHVIVFALSVIDYNGLSLKYKQWESKGFERSIERTLQRAADGRKRSIELDAEVEETFRKIDESLREAGFPPLNRTRKPPNPQG